MREGSGTTTDISSLKFSTDLGITTVPLTANDKPNEYIVNLGTRTKDGKLPKAK